MKRQHTRGWRAWLALLLSLTLVAAAACADDDDEGGEDEGGQGDGGSGGVELTGDYPDLEGEEISILGPEVTVERESLDEAFTEFEEATGADVLVDGTRNFESDIGGLIDGGTPPNIAMFPQPGLIAGFADDVVPVPDGIASTVEENFDPGWTELVTEEGALQAVPAKADLKGVVFYSPSAWEDAGYEIPETLEDFESLAEQMVDDGNTPFCLGTGSDDATGWPLTDWVEDYVLRLNGPELYDQWYNHEIPFDHPEIVETGEHVFDFLSQEGMVLGGLENVAATNHADAGLPLLDGDCMMIRISNYLAANFIDAGASMGDDGDVSAFRLPGTEENPDVTLSGGIYATALVDDEATMAALEYIASTDFANARADNEQGGYLSPNQNVDTSLYPDEITRTFGEILAEADPVRFDASDLMPGEVGAGSFWTAVNDISAGTATVPEAFAAAEESWPG
jgi:alpha-glucoside transport system substrate-binding protein